MQQAAHAVLHRAKAHEHPAASTAKAETYVIFVAKYDRCSRCEADAVVQHLDTTNNGILQMLLRHVCLT